MPLGQSVPMICRDLTKEDQKQQSIGKKKKVGQVSYSFGSRKQKAEANQLLKSDPVRKSKDS